MKAIIVDDEKAAREGLRTLIEDSFPQITIAAEAQSVAEAVKVINHEKPKLLFLDIELGKGTGFDILKKIKLDDVEIIFTTAHESYALQAIKFSALDYLLKPITADDLREALEKLERRTAKLSLHDILEIFRHNLDHTSVVRKKLVLMQGQNRLEVVPVNEIIRCQSDGNYTHFFLKDKKKITIPKTLKEYESMLDKSGFCRVHHTHLINMEHVKGYIKGDGGFALMNDNTEVEVSRRKKDEFLKLLFEK